MLENARTFGDVYLLSLCPHCTPESSTWLCSFAVVTLEICLLCVHIKSHNEPRARRGREIDSSSSITPQAASWPKLQLPPLTPLPT